MTVYDITGDDGAGWTLRRDRVVVDTYDGIRDAMEAAAHDAGRPLTWRLTPDGFAGRDEQ